MGASGGPKGALGGSQGRVSRRVYIGSPRRVSEGPRGVSEEGLGGALQEESSGGPRTVPEVKGDGRWGPKRVFKKIS